MGAGTTFNLYNEWQKHAKKGIGTHQISLMHVLHPSPYAGLLLDWQYFDFLLKRSCC